MDKSHVVPIPQQKTMVPTVAELRPISLLPILEILKMYEPFLIVKDTVIKLQWLLPLYRHFCTVIALLQLGRVHLMNISDFVYEFLYTGKIVLHLYIDYIPI